MLRLYEKSPELHEIVLLAMAKIFIKQRSDAFLQIFVEKLSTISNSLYKEFSEIREETVDIFEAENRQQAIEDFILKNGIDEVGYINYKFGRLRYQFERLLQVNNLWLKIVSPKVEVLSDEIQSLTRLMQEPDEISRLIRKEIERQQAEAQNKGKGIDGR